MLGLEAINANNGWAISALGVSIVFSGLILLSFSVSQIHKLLNLWDNRSKLFQLMKDKSEDQSEKTQNQNMDEKVCHPKGFDEAVKQVKLIINRIGEPFSLPKLLTIAINHGMHCAHSTLNFLLTEGIIEPVGDGFYRLSDKAKK